MTDDDKIQVELTDESELQAFKITIPAVDQDGKPGWAEFLLSTRQGFDLFAKLGERLMDYFARESDRLLRMKRIELEGLGKVRARGGGNDSGLPKL